jgi:hypothetical protein
MAADVVVLTAEHREYLAALAHDLAAQGAALQHEPPVRLPVVVA